MPTRREFFQLGAVVSGVAGVWDALIKPIERALAIEPDSGSSVFDAEHIVILMQENRSFDHCFGTLQGVRGFDDPRAITLPNGNPVWVQTSAASESFAPFRLNISETNSTWLGCLPHSWQSQVDARNGGRYDRWLDAKRSDQKIAADLPLTLGYYNRQDIPFYYQLADAFTICDQHFCSCLSSTTPNRLHLWTGTIRERPTADCQANICNENVDYDSWAAWKTFPERLEEHGVSWRIYQNEIGLPTGLGEDEYAWLANFGDNPIEYFSQFQVKLATNYRDYLDKHVIELPDVINKLKERLAAAGNSLTESGELLEQLSNATASLKYIKEERGRWPKGGLDKLSTRARNLHERAFTTNLLDPAYRELATLNSREANERTDVAVPKGDLFHKFRHDVQSGNLPTVCWLVAPERFSDHPDSPWYGAWYISEALNILTQNPETWKKTIFVLTYDENDGYFDHVPPFVPPRPHRPETGLASKGIDTSVEYIELEQDRRRVLGGPPRESPIGLGYRVPLIIASPWSRGGCVCSQVFDHTSVLQFLECFLTRKTGKPIEESNISAWRRTVCGDLTSVFQSSPRPQGKDPSSKSRDSLIDDINRAKFKPRPAGYKRLTPAEISSISESPSRSPHMPHQEKGTRRSCPLPYELNVNGSLSADRSRFIIEFEARNDHFGNRAAGSPFTVYAMTGGGEMQVRNYGVAAGDRLEDSWNLDEFTGGRYRLRVHGPNGFYREFAGQADDPQLDIRVTAHKIDRSLTGDLKIELTNRDDRRPYSVTIRDRSYKGRELKRKVAGGESALFVVDTQSSFQWYDVEISIAGSSNFERRYAGRVEIGAWTFTDPAIGRPEE
jgi:phospholipase C